jgi:PUA domain protein
MNYKIRNRHRLKSKEIKKIVDELKENFMQDFFDLKTSIEIGEVDNQDIVFVDNEPSLMYYDNKIFFTLHGLNKYRPKHLFVVVDMGAVKFVSSGADVMAPGIVDADKKINENDLVWICDETHRKPLAVGIALMSGDKMISEKSGKSVNIFHHVGDSLWGALAKQN